MAEMTDCVSRENMEKIKKNFQHLDETEGESFSNGVWSVKNKEFPKIVKPTPATKVGVKLL